MPYLYTDNFLINPFFSTLQDVSLDMAIGYCAATLSTMALLPQIYQIWVTRSAKDISFLMLAFLLTSSVIQLIYALLTKQYPVILTNCISISLRSLVLGCKVYMDRRV